MDKSLGGRREYKGKRGREQGRRKMGGNRNRREEEWMGIRVQQAREWKKQEI